MASKRFVPKTMATQHPDNVTSPFFATQPELGGEDEVHEAYYAFSHLGCTEQMWDCEGKETDTYVVKKLLSRHESYFREHKLGKDVFITLRVPNPSVETTEAKILLETLESIPRSYDAAKLFYDADQAPIFEVILPMTGSAKELNRIYHYYKDFIVGKQASRLMPGDIKVSDWVGEFNPSTINVIPLFEAMDQMLHCGDITREFLKNKEVDSQRVFLARSDPAMNYGNVSAVLLNKIALQNLWDFQESSGIKIYPILGIGSAPFRGNMRPDTVDSVIGEYPSVHTYSIQSAFKYDNSPEEARAAIQKINEHKTRAPQRVEAERCLEIIRKIVQNYQSQISKLAPVVNKVARYVPERRRRKMHVGLFGYSRNVEGIKLPRAIKFAAALHSIGLPPEILGLSTLSADDFKYLRKVYRTIDEDISYAMSFLNPKALKLAESLGVDLGTLPFEFTINRAHAEATTSVLKSIENEQVADISSELLRAASIRRFLG